jgi:hypothetical protein
VDKLFQKIQSKLLGSLLSVGLLRLKIWQLSKSKIVRAICYKLGLTVVVNSGYLIVGVIVTLDDQFFIRNSIQKRCVKVCSVWCR